MEVRIIAPINNLILESKIDIFPVDFFKIANSKFVLEQHFFNSHTFEACGGMRFKELSQSPFIYYKGTVEYLSNYIRFTNMPDTLKRLNGYFSLLVNSFWFIKDNAVSSDTALMYNTETGYTDIDSRNTFISNSSGEYTLTRFSNDELADIINIYRKVLLMMEIKDLGVEPIIENTDTVRMEVSPINKLKHNKLSRFYKAIMFLQFARNNSYLPLKISFYVVMMETLFGLRGDKEVLKEICHRISGFIKNQFGSTDNLTKQIKDTYNVRSRFLHGDYIDEDMEKLKTISMNADVLLRMILMKIIDTESHYFTLSNSKTDKNTFREYLTNF